MSPDKPTAWDAALEIMEKLRTAGHAALLAGGCVRDRLMGNAPKDYDVVTDATPAQVRRMFPRTRHVGAKFGVVLVRKYGVDIEVATFRTDGTYSDGRRPDEVRFGTELEDAQRRDFTINGLFLDPISGELIDHVGGRADLEAGILRTIGEPDRRFAEDHLRMLRAIRFAARLRFTIEPGTMEAIIRLAGHLQTISPERVWQELEQILTEPTRAVGWSLLVRTGLRDHLSTDWPRMMTDEDEIIERRLTALPDRVIDASLALSTALPARTPAQAGKIGRALRLSNRMIRRVTYLVRSLPALHDAGALDLAGLKLLMADEAWPLLIELLRVDLVAAGQSLEAYKEVSRRAATIAPEDVAPPPLLTGDDLALMGVPPGPRYGEILETVYRAQLNEKITTPEQAHAMARTLLAQ